MSANALPVPVPSFWTDDIETAWRAARTRTLSSWGRSGRVPRKVLRRVAEEAVVLGFAARRAFPATAMWSIDLEARLEGEWAGSGSAADTPWERVSAAARHGWENAHGVVWPVDGSSR